ncbi:MAG: hypothetical protein LBI43_03790 [Streptococcaceae bacterium]|jgi:hypothetical protein|nr:hypothetical protein [Streptococcaceae bacterium]
MTVQFPIFPDEQSFSPDNRTVMTNRQIFTRKPDRSEEESLMRFGNYGAANYPMSSRNLPQGQRTKYATVKRSLGGVTAGEQVDAASMQGQYAVNTYERSFKKTVSEESKEKAKRYLRDNQPKKLKGYKSILERQKEQQGFQKAAETPKITQERWMEYQQRKGQAVPMDQMNFDNAGPLQAATPDNTRRQTNDLFSPQQRDYFKQKREGLFSRGGTL